MVAARVRIVARKAMHHETFGRGVVALYRKRTILGAVSRSRHERFAVGYITTERRGDLFNRGRVICWHGNRVERAGRSPGLTNTLSVSPPRYFAFPTYSSIPAALG